MAPELSEWREFFVTTATVAGALVGLLFVAVSVHLRLLSDERYVDLRLDARAILLGYVVAMSLSLFPLVPQSLAALGQEILIVFIFIVATSVRSVPGLFRSSGVYGRRNRWFRLALLVTGCAATLAGGLALLAGQAWPLQLLAASVMLLIVVSVFRTWDIVFRAARVAPRASGPSQLLRSAARPASSRTVPRSAASTMDWHFRVDPLHQLRRAS